MFPNLVFLQLQQNLVIKLNDNVYLFNMNVSGQHNKHLNRMISLAVIWHNVRLCSIFWGFYYMKLSLLILKTPQYPLHHCGCHFKLSVPLQLLHQLPPVEYLFKHYHIHLTVLCAIYCRDETHKVASYTRWLKMLSQPFNLASQCCYVWWIAGLTYSSSDLIWIVACS